MVTLQIKISEQMNEQLDKALEKSVFTDKNDLILFILQSWLDNHSARPEEKDPAMDADLKQRLKDLGYL